MKSIYTSGQKCIERIKSLPEGNHVIAIDGRCAAGKTTLAHYLSKNLGAGVVHMDDFFLPTALRTAERLAEPGGNVHYERFMEEVIPFLKTGRAFSYQKFDCSMMQLGGRREVLASSIVIVEGAYSCNPKLSDYMSLKLFMDVDKEEQLRRIRNRNGEEKMKMFQKKWIPMEEAYFAEYGIEEQADIIIRMDDIC